MDGPIELVVLLKHKRLICCVEYPRIAANVEIFRVWLYGFLVLELLLCDFYPLVNSRFEVNILINGIILEFECAYLLGLRLLLVQKVKQI
jgi:hypothetical protein